VTLQQEYVPENVYRQSIAFDIKLIYLRTKSGTSLVNTVQWLGWCPEELGFEFRLRHIYSSFRNRPDGLWGPQSSLFNERQGLFTEAMRPRREANDSPISGTEVKNEWV